MNEYMHRNKQVTPSSLPSYPIQVPCLHTLAETSQGTFLSPHHWVPGTVKLMTVTLGGYSKHGILTYGAHTALLLATENFFWKNIHFSEPQFP